jgi:N-acetylglucosaminyl-diphospho-decaprenol L-rhamnosyltransferase
MPPSLVLDDPVQVQQVLLTRFNIRNRYVGHTPEQAEEWLEQRFVLFERYCAPSIVSQTQEDFDWVIFCDPSTSPDNLRRIRATDPRIRIVFVGDPAQVTILPDEVERIVPNLLIAPHIRPGTQVVVGTRLDNDDALNRAALARVRELVPTFLRLDYDRLLYNPRLGYKFDHERQRLYRVEHDRSPFLTLFERVDDKEPPRGPLSGSHSTMPTKYPTFHDGLLRAWVMVLHGTNISNRRLRADEYVHLSELRDEFLFPRGQ